MTVYQDYQITDYLEDVSFIAGSKFILYFQIQNDADVTPLINGASAKWALALYGQPEVRVLQKTATAYDQYTFMVELDEADTIGLTQGVYVQQIRIRDHDGNYYRPAQGMVIIRRAIPITD